MQLEGYVIADLEEIMPGMMRVQCGNRRRGLWKSLWERDVGFLVEA
jgi:hypothetical protein